MRVAAVLSISALAALAFGLVLGCATMHPEAAASLRVDCNLPDAAGHTSFQGAQGN